MNIVSEYKRLIGNSIFRNTLQMIFFGLLSYLFSMVNFYIPEAEGAASNLSEIPLLISVFHISNPLFLIGEAAFPAFGTPPEGSWLSTFIFHAISLMVVWYINRFLRKYHNKITVSGILNFFLVLTYYLIFLLPIMIFTNYLAGLNNDRSFISFYSDLVNSVRFEMIACALITPLYLIQFLNSKALHKERENLELTVQERTKDLKHTLEELKITQQHLVQSEKMASLGTLTDGIAHEINNPLNFIAGGIHILEEFGDNFNDPLKKDMKDQFDKAINVINEGLTRSTKIVKTLMDFSDRGIAELRPVNLNEIIENTFLFVKHQISENIQVIKKYELDQNVFVYTEKMHQIILNVLENSIYELDIAENVNKILMVKTYKKENYAVLRISNNGKKIPNDQILKIFDPFFTTKDPGKGIGLGLSVAFSLVKEHRGNIYAENSDEYVHFYIELPLE